MCFCYSGSTSSRTAEFIALGNRFSTARRGMSWRLARIRRKCTLFVNTESFLGFSSRTNDARVHRCQNSEYFPHLTYFKKSRFFGQFGYLARQFRQFLHSVREHGSARLVRLRKNVIKFPSIKRHYGEKLWISLLMIGEFSTAGNIWNLVRRI